MAPSSATRTGWYSGSSSTPDPTRRRVVLAAIAAATSSGEGKEPWKCWWCSVMRHESNPACSATWASAMISSNSRSRCSTCERSGRQGAIPNCIRVLLSVHGKVPWGITSRGLLIEIRPYMCCRTTARERRADQGASHSTRWLGYMNMYLYS